MEKEIRKKKEKRKLITINNEMLHNAAWDAAQFKRLDRRPRAVPVYSGIFVFLVRLNN